MMRRVSTLLVLALLAGCGGGGGTTPPVGSGGTTPSTPATMAIKLTLNPGSSAPAVKSARGRNYVSYSTAGLGIDVVAHVNNGSSALPKTTESAMRSPLFATKIAPGFTGPNASCTALVAGAYSCTLIVSAPAGYDDIQMTAWDAAPSSNGFGGTFASTAHSLSTNFFANQLVLQNQTNNLNLVMDGVVRSVTLQTTVNTLVSGAPLGQVVSGTTINPASVTLSVFANDAQGNRIVGADPYVDANGNPVTVTVNKSETQPAVPLGSTTPAVTLTGATCASNVCTYTQPGGTASVGYNGNDLSSVAFTSSTNSSLDSAISKVNATISFTRSTNGTVNVPGPQSTLQISAGEGPFPLIGSVALGADGDDYFGISYGGGGGTNVGHLIKVAPGASPVAVDIDLSSSACDTSRGINAIASGTDNAMWFVAGDNTTAPSLCSRSLAGSVVSFGNLGFAPGSMFTGMALDRNGLMWIAVNAAGGEAWAVGVNATGTVVKRADLGANALAAQVVIGAVDGHLYVALANGIASVDVNAATPIVPVFIAPAPGFMQNNGYGIASTPDGLGGQYVFFSEAGQNGTLGYLDRYDGTTWTQASIPGSTTWVLGLGVGPDGNVYAATDGNEVARINPALFPAANSIATIATGRSWAVAPGSDNSMWVAQWYTGNLTKISMP